MPPTSRGMPIDYEIDEKAGVMVMTMSGHLTRDDFLAYFASSEKDSRFKPDMGRLIIATEATGFPPSAEIPEVADRMRRRIQGSSPRFAVVTTSPLGIGMSSMFMGQSGLSDHFQVFPDRASAMKWLAARPGQG